MVGFVPPVGGRSRKSHLSSYLRELLNGRFSHITPWTCRQRNLVIHHIYMGEERRWKEREDYVGVLNVLLLPGGGH